MRTVEEFQKDVLTPLRKQRDEKFAETYTRCANVKTAYQREMNALVEEKIAFCKKQKDELEAFKKQQAFDMGTFNAEQRTRKTNAYNIYTKGMYQVKQDRRNINETYQDKLGAAFARYNKERMAAGETPIEYDFKGNVKQVQPDGEEGEQEDNGNDNE